MNNYFNIEGTILEIPYEVTNVMYGIIEKYSKQYWVNNIQYPWEGMWQEKYDEMIDELNKAIKANFIGFPLIKEVRNWGAYLRNEPQFENKSAKVTVVFDTDCLVKVVGQPEDTEIADKNN